ncbi:MAG: SH3 domain-containing protein [Pseudomonadota bacterium]
MSKAFLMISTLVLGTVALVSPALASGALPAGELYICDEGEPYTQVLIPSDKNAAPIMLLENEQLEMAAVPSGSGTRFDLITPNGHRIVETKGAGQVIFQIDDQPAKACTFNVAISDDTPNSARDIVSAVGNFSLGGNVRSGPGMDFDRVDALRFAEPVAITERTGVVMDGYEWFKIEYSEGLEGYQWGGIMCSNAPNISGLYAPCPPELAAN